MLFKDLPIQRRLVSANLLISGIVLLLTCVALFSYEYYNFRKTTIRHLSVLGEITAANSTAALAFDSPEEGNDILAALKAEKHIIAAVLFDAHGVPFAYYPATLVLDTLPLTPAKRLYQYKQAHLEGFQPVIQGNKVLGTLYLKSDLKEMDERLKLYALIIVAVLTICFGLAYLLSKFLQKGISGPILALAETATAVSQRKDYSVRATKWGNDELGLLTDAFNHMLLQIQEQNKQYTFLTDAIPQMVWSSGPDGKAAYLNQNWYNYTGQSLEEAKDEGWFKKIHPDDVIASNKLFAEALANGTVFETKLRIADSKGYYNWHLTRSVPMKGPDGQIIRWIGTSTNIHDQVLKTQELERINDELDNFVYSASHDLRTPILNVESLLHLMKSRLPANNNVGIQNIYSRMELSIEKLKATIHDMADISRIQHEPAEIAETIFMPELLEEYISTHELLIESNGATITSSFEQQEIRGMSRKHLRSLLDNLLSNAIKYRHPQRTPSIQINTRLEEDIYVITISDNGVGIAPEHQDKVFDMFRRFSTYSKGSGIGLYLVKKIVDKYEGKVTIVSTLNKGTSFTIRFKKYKNLNQYG